MGEDVKEMLRLLQPQRMAGFAIAQWISVEGGQSSSPLADRDRGRNWSSIKTSEGSCPCKHICNLSH
ncbi:hypothetical protein LXL04_015001 [Taraxacum kok-saghyz]